MEANLTEKALAKTMKHLLSQKPLCKISIKDITSECQINRKTYYYHFRDKYELVNWIFLDEFYNYLDYNNISNVWDFLEPLSVYFYENKKYYRNAFAYKGQNSFSSFFAELIEPPLKQHFEEVFAQNEFYGLYADYVSFGIVLVFERWLKDHDYIEPEKFVEIMKNAVFGLAEKVLSEKEDLSVLKSKDEK